MRARPFPKWEIRYRSLVPLIMHIVPILAFTVGIVCVVISRMPERINGFRREESDVIKKLNISVRHYVHDTIQAQLLHVESEDTHSFFATTFRTVPVDDSGVFNAIRRMVMQGSANYPVPNLFDEMRKRSVATAMDSMSTDEWTAFYLSTTNRNDFFNLLSVQLDSIFNPLLSNYSYMSEIHRYELDDLDDMKSALRHGGIVYNEVLESRQRADKVFSDEVRRGLYNSSSRCSFEGTPEGILGLDIERVRRVHNTYYHPSNAMFFYYGPLSAGDIIGPVVDVIGHAGKRARTANSAVKRRTKWKKPHKLRVTGPYDRLVYPGTIQASAAWAVGDVTNVSDAVDLSCLGILLTETCVSPMFKGLIKTGLGGRFIDTGHFMSMKNPYFAIGLSGYNPVFAEYPQTVLSILSDVFESGFPENMVDSLFNAYEIQQSKSTASRGYKLWQQIVGNWIHGVNPLELLDVSWETERLRRIVTVQPRYFELLMKQRLIDNQHRLDFVMNSSQGFNEEVMRSVKVGLRATKRNMSFTDLTAMIVSTENLAGFRRSDKQLDSLPSITVEDLDPMHIDYRVDVRDGVYMIATDTDDMVYVDIKAMIPLDDDAVIDMILLSRVLTGIGTDKLDEEEFTVMKRLYTGGIECELKVRRSLDLNVQLMLVIRTSAMSRNAGHMLKLLQSMILRPRLANRKEIAVLLSMDVIDNDKRIDREMGNLMHMFAAGGLSKVVALNEMCNGLSGMAHIAKLVKGEDWETIGDRIDRVYRDVFMRSTFTAAVRCSEKQRTGMKAVVHRVLESLNGGRSTLGNETDKIQSHIDTLKEHPRRFFVNENQATFALAVSMSCGNTTTSTIRKTATCSVLTKLLQSEFLRTTTMDTERVGRITGLFDRVSDTISLVSVGGSDPPEVMHKIDRSITDVGEERVSREMLQRAILQVVADLDAPIPASDKGGDSFLYRISRTDTELLRKAVKNVSLADVMLKAKTVMAGERRYALIGPPQDPGRFTEFDMVNVFERDTSGYDN